VLADKELSALLGGLSGYILGKYNNKVDDKPKENLTNQQIETHANDTNIAQNDQK
jgi:membrane protein YqaA with SNARE-associated domain